MPHIWTQKCSRFVGPTILVNYTFLNKNIGGGCRGSNKFLQNHTVIPKNKIDPYRTQMLSQIYNWVNWLIHHREAQRAEVRNINLGQWISVSNKRSTEMRVASPIKIQNIFLNIWSFQIWYKYLINTQHLSKSGLDWGSGRGTAHTKTI